MTPLMLKNRPVLLMALAGLVTFSACDSAGQLSTLAGKASIDGTPVHRGTIHFQSTASSKSSGGGTVADGNFTVTSNSGFEPGEYEVVLQAFRKTGRTLNDPQKGKVEETADVVLSQPSQRVTINAENAEHLSLNYRAAAK